MISIMLVTVIKTSRPGLPEGPESAQACALDSLYGAITYFYFSLLQRRLKYDYDTECSFVYLMA